MTPKQDLGLSECRSDRSGDKIVARHQIADRSLWARSEPQVAVCEDADEKAVGRCDGNARNTISRHQLEGIADEVVGAEGDRLDDHPGLTPLDLVDLRHLVGNRKIPVDDSKPALSRQGDRETCLGDRVHRR